MSDLEAAIAAHVLETHPGWAEAIRQLKHAGAEKSEIIHRITSRTKSAPLSRHSLLIAVDVIWEET